MEKDQTSETPANFFEFKSRYCVILVNSHNPIRRSFQHYLFVYDVNLSYLKGKRYDGKFIQIFTGDILQVQEMTREQESAFKKKQWESRGKKW